MTDIVSPGDLLNFANDKVCQDFPDPTGCLAVFLKAVPANLLDEAISSTDSLIAAAAAPILTAQSQLEALQTKILEITSAIEIKNALFSTLDALVLQADTFLSEGVPCAELTLLRDLWSGLREQTTAALNQLDSLRDDLNSQFDLFNAQLQVLDCVASNFARVRGVLDTVSTGDVAG